VRALTITQPWASLLARGDKRVENRTWAPPEELVGEQVALHASREFDQFDRYLIRRRYGIAIEQADCPLGAVVAVGRLTDVLRESQDPWFMGPYGWVFTDITRIDPVPCRGARRLWTLPPDVLLRVERGLRSNAARKVSESRAI
jgi:hypothetical protein